MFRIGLLDVHQNLCRLPSFILNRRKHLARLDLTELCFPEEVSVSWSVKWHRLLIMKWSMQIQYNWKLFLLVSLALFRELKGIIIQPSSTSTAPNNSFEDGNLFYIAIASSLVCGLLMIRNSHESAAERNQQQNSWSQWNQDTRSTHGEQRKISATAWIFAHYSMNDVRKHFPSQRKTPIEEAERFDSAGRVNCMDSLLTWLEELGRCSKMRLLDTKRILHANIKSHLRCG